MPKDTYIPCLLQLFRQYGYDGATLAKISQATGLGKASLYHYFPGGKEEMVTTVLDYLAQWLEQHILQPLRYQGDALARFQSMSDSISELYAGGQQPCLLAILLMGSTRDVFQPTLRSLLHSWIEAIAEVLIAAGLNETLAKQRGEDAIIAIQGSLILSHGLNDFAPFQRTLAQLPQQLCQGLLG
ncbi:TetR/AcrR family transcriptional regulator [Aliterella atlantica]|uniref:TetR family transcriptional regulator n=1 Tax=Aliterella atlantica CENA595 TaxID=1618023 RepID=A0A0D8ZNP0_9CYAN|nr:TetR/AcrR family transcriptional regulator [Aliterella atlantica]KJH70104.1 TetR family transcriptional regulator [Aliterella atlantica CENA595]